MGKKYIIETKGYKEGVGTKKYIQKKKEELKRMEEKIKHPKISFDFDSTLSRKDVQEYCAYLIKSGIDVWVVTSRYDELHKHRFTNNPTNEDLYNVTDKLGIPRYKIRFTCMRNKAEYLFGTDILWHLDDDSLELELINEQTNVFGIDVNGKNWKQICNLSLRFE